MDLYDIPDSNVDFFRDSFYNSATASSISSSIPVVLDSNKSINANFLLNNVSKDLNIVNLKTIPAAQGSIGQNLGEQSSKIFKSGIVIIRKPTV